MNKDVKEAVSNGKDVYLLVVYCTDGGVHLLPRASKEECYEKLLRMRMNEKIAKRMKATTIIKRSAAGFNGGFLFGHPKSLDVMALSDKAFEKACSGLEAEE